MNNSYAARHLLAAHAAKVAASGSKRTDSIVKAPLDITQKRLDIAIDCWEATRDVTLGITKEMGGLSSEEIALALEGRSRLLDTLKCDYVKPDDAEEWWEKCGMFVHLDVFSADDLCALQSAKQIDGGAHFRPKWESVAHLLRTRSIRPTQFTGMTKFRPRKYQRKAPLMKVSIVDYEDNVMTRPPTPRPSSPTIIHGDQSNCVTSTHIYEVHTPLDIDSWLFPIETAMI